MILEAANSLLDRFDAAPDVSARIHMFFELVRRNFSPDIILTYGKTQMGGPSVEGTTRFHAALTGADGVTGSLAASYSASGNHALTAEEWTVAMRLLVGILVLGIEGVAAHDSRSASC